MSDAILNQFGLKKQLCLIPTFGLNLTIPRVGLHKNPPQKQILFSKNPSDFNSSQYLTKVDILKRFTVFLPPCVFNIYSVEWVIHQPHGQFFGYFLTPPPPTVVMFTK